MRSPVPPPRPEGQGVWEKEYVGERAAGVAVFSGMIQVSVRAKKWRVLEGGVSQNGQFSWQFQSPPLTWRSVLVEIVGVRVRVRVREFYCQPNVCTDIQRAEIAFPSHPNHGA